MSHQVMPVSHFQRRWLAITPLGGRRYGAEGGNRSAKTISETCARNYSLGFFFAKR